MPAPKTTRREFTIYSADRDIHTVKAPSLRAALRRSRIDESKVIAAIETNCLPAPEDTVRPFLAVLLENRNYQPPEIL